MANSTAALQWQDQFRAMRAAIAELNLPSTVASTEYGRDILSDNEDLSGADDSDELWDYITDDESGEYSSDQMDGSGKDFGKIEEDDEFNRAWLEKKCGEMKSGFKGAELADQINALLSSDSNGMAHPSCELCELKLKYTVR
jgi:antiviral helicase SLH1